MRETTTLVCWKCGGDLADEPLPLGRQAECRACGAPLHVCRMCRFHDPAVANACREPVADPVQDKSRANFCGYLEPSPHAYRAADTGAARDSRDALAALFGEAPGQAGGAGDPAQDGDDARRRLEDLFGDRTD